jgi:hypothetical protein
MDTNRPTLASHPDLASQWEAGGNALAAEEVGLDLDVEGWWQCPENDSLPGGRTRQHRWREALAVRLRDERCPFCAVLEGLPMTVLGDYPSKLDIQVPALLVEGPSWSSKEAKRKAHVSVEFDRQTVAEVMQQSGHALSVDWPAVDLEALEDLCWDAVAIRRARREEDAKRLELAARLSTLQARNKRLQFLVRQEQKRLGLVGHAASPKVRRTSRAKPGSTPPRSGKAAVSKELKRLLGDLDECAGQMAWVSDKLASLGHRFPGEPSRTRGGWPSEEQLQRFIDSGQPNSSDPAWFTFFRALCEEGMRAQPHGVVSRERWEEEVIEAVLCVCGYGSRRPLYYGLANRSIRTTAWKRRKIDVVRKVEGRRKRQGRHQRRRRVHHSLSDEAILAEVEVAMLIEMVPLEQAASSSATEDASPPSVGVGSAPLVGLESPTAIRVRHRRAVRCTAFGFASFLADESVPAEASLLAYAWMLRDKRGMSTNRLGRDRPPRPEYGPAEIWLRLSPGTLPPHRREALLARLRGRSAALDKAALEERFENAIDMHLRVLDRLVEIARDEPRAAVNQPEPLGLNALADAWARVVCPGVTAKQQKERETTAGHRLRDHAGFRRWTKDTWKDLGEEGPEIPEDLEQWVLEMMEQDLRPLAPVRQLERRLEASMRQREAQGEQVLRRAIFVAVLEQLTGIYPGLGTPQHRHGRENIRVKPIRPEPGRGPGSVAEWRAARADMREQARREPARSDALRAGQRWRGQDGALESIHEAIKHWVDTAISTNTIGDTTDDERISALLSLHEVSAAATWSLHPALVDRVFDLNMSTLAGGWEDPWRARRVAGWMLDHCDFHEGDRMKATWEWLAHAPDTGPGPRSRLLMLAAGAPICFQPGALVFRASGSDLPVWTETLSEHLAVEHYSDGVLVVRAAAGGVVGADDWPRDAEGRAWRQLLPGEVLHLQVSEQALTLVGLDSGETG